MLVARGLGKRRRGAPQFRSQIVTTVNDDVFVHLKYKKVNLLLTSVTIIKLN